MDASNEQPGVSDVLRELVAEGRFQAALATFRDAAAAGPVSAEAELLAATAATRIAQFELAASLAQSALERFRGRGDRDGYMRCLNLEGAIAFERGRLQEAERYFAEALQLAQELNDSLMTARLSNNLGSVALWTKPREVALSLYRTALLSYQRLGDRRGTAETYHNLGVTFREMLDWGDAAEAGAEAVRHAAEVGDPALVALTIMGRAETNLERGAWPIARQELDRVTRFVEAANDDIGRVDLQRLRSLLSLKLGQFDAALEQAEAGTVEARRVGSALLEAECLTVAARALRSVGDPAAESRRAEAARLLHGLGATNVVEKFERAWDAE